MNDYKKYWIWLSTVLGAGARVDEILSVYPEPHMLFESSEKDRFLSGVFSKKQFERNFSTKLDDALAAMSVCEKNGWQIITPDDEEYPEWLAKIPDMPLTLYVDGDLSCIKDKVTIGVVGTRKPSDESVVITRRICGDLSAAGAVIISGGALGIDSAAHEGTLDAGGKTVCVMGCGLGTRYLVENTAMRRRIAENGAVISEYPPFTSASRVTFPRRNRIISGLSMGVLVVEAGDFSGSLITAECAKKQGREVFSIPGSVLSTAYKGANTLIRDGAKIASSATDILIPYEMMYPERLNLSAIDPSPITASSPEKPKVRQACPPDLDPDSKAVYNLFGNEALHPDEICALSSLSPSKVITALMRLEIKGLIEQTEGKNYILK